ncbi:MAG: carbonic anhydrase [Armatimonadota bacterium]
MERVFPVEQKVREEFAHTLAIYCSDGRFAPACEQFIRQALGEEWYDRFVVPGGAAWLCMDVLTVWEHEMARRHLSFLVDAHRIQRVILIAHQQCGFYERYHLSPEQTVQKQMADLQAATRIFYERFTGITVEAYYLRVVDGQPRFEPVADGHGT